MENTKVVQNIKHRLNELSNNNVNKDTPDIKQKQIKNTSVSKCILEGISYDIISSNNIAPGIECHLAKYSNGYAVLSDIGNKIDIIKTYDSLNSERMYSRLSEKLADGTPRYLIKIGLNKIIVDVIDGQLKYVMDL